MAEASTFRTGVLAVALLAAALMLLPATTAEASCSTGNRVDHRDAECLSAWWKNRGLLKKSPYHVRNMCPEYGKVGKRSATPWLPRRARAANGRCGRKLFGSTLGSNPLVGRLHGLAERLPFGHAVAAQARAGSERPLWQETVWFDTRIQPAGGTPPRSGRTFTVPSGRGIGDIGIIIPIGLRSHKGAGNAFCHALSSSAWRFLTRILAPT